MTLTYSVEFFSYWHAGSGLSGRTYADLMVNRDARGLPYVPGRTLKGLLREAAETIHALNAPLVTTDFIEVVFGPRTDEPSPPEGRPFSMAEGFFTNAALPPAVADRIVAEEYTDHLYDVLASTSIDADGLAAQGTLRQIEVTVPLTLRAAVEQFPDRDDYRTQFATCLKWVKRLGQGRTRGLGRCRLSLADRTAS